ncbi:hypothetical protein KPH14_013064 [Odynerus spinipes]|uniref:Uncharacterized protein n=1 Tax=Odynerus spinipes TaxID=1348599 RepID=A0AAD9R7V0_9HYME|nr:hypothetical protein KPH14_013064 [Odynerus spinipes]
MASRAIMSASDAPRLEFDQETRAVTTTSVNGDNSSSQLANLAKITNGDVEFTRFLMSRMFTSGVHAWWLIGLLFILFILSTIFMFFGSLLDTKYLFASHELTSAESIRRLNEYENLQDRLNLEYPQLERLSTLVAARHALGDPLLPTRN